MSQPALHVVQVSFFVSAPEHLPPQILEGTISLVLTAEAVALGGGRVTVIQACGHNQVLTRNGIDYHFLKPAFGENTISSSTAFRALIRKLAPDVFHVHGLGYPRDTLTLAALAPGVPIFLQDHANRVPRFWHRRAWRRGLAAASGIAFCALAQAQPFRKHGLVGECVRLHEIPECTSRFTPGDRARARELTGMRGDPALLWVGHLNDNKDPLTVLEGFAAVAAQLPAAELWCAYGTAPLMDQVRRRIDADERLRGRVHLLGKLPAERIEQLMRAADFFVLGSHREGSGYSLIEALACGLPPVVTDIPSFRVLTGNEQVGGLWPRGDATAFAQRLLALARQPSAPQRVAAREHFDRSLSLEALGRQLTTAYRHTLAHE